jgi:hypothetical protein
VPFFDLGTVAADNAKHGFPPGLVKALAIVHFSKVLTWIHFLDS